MSVWEQMRARHARDTADSKAADRGVQEGRQHVPGHMGWQVASHHMEGRRVLARSSCAYALTTFHRHWDSNMCSIYSSKWRIPRHNICIVLCI
jgi:hypothetical protein